MLKGLSISVRPEGQQEAILMLCGKNCLLFRWKQSGLGDTRLLATSVLWVLKRIWSLIGTNASLEIIRYDTREQATSGIGLEVRLVLVQNSY